MGLLNYVITTSTQGAIPSTPLPYIDFVIDHHEHMFVIHNIGHLFCKGHLDDILAFLLFHHLKLTTLKGDNPDLILGWFNSCFTIIVVKIILVECMFKL
jgi:hypothetical protein